MALNNTKEDVTFASVLADGKIHVTVPEGTEGAVVRTYETSDKKTGTKTELVYTELVGKIEKVAFRDGDYGTQFLVTVVDGDEKPVVLSLGTASNFGEDFMKKILAVDMERNVKIVPFAFEDDKGKSKKGITIYQMNAAGNESVKVPNYFYDPATKENLHGYPKPKIAKGKPLTKDQWKLYFAEVRQFLVEKITEHFGLDKEAAPADAKETKEKVAEEVDGWAEDK